MITCHEEMHQFTVVCRIAIKLGHNSRRTGQPTGGLVQLGLEEFGLNSHQVGACIGRARDEIAENIRLDRIRKGGRVNFPTASDEIIARMRKVA